MHCEAQQSPQRVAYAMAARMGISQELMWPTITGPNPVSLTATSYTIQGATNVIYVDAKELGRQFTYTPSAVLDWIEFNELAEKWKKNQAPWRSFSGDLMRDPSYARIVRMAERAVRPILWDIQKELASGKVSNWFYALWIITDENPLPPEAQGKPLVAAQAWIDWGKRKGLIYDANVGSVVSAVR